MPSWLMDSSSERERGRKLERGERGGREGGRGREREGERGGGEGKRGRR